MSKDLRSDRPKVTLLIYEIVRPKEHGSELTVKLSKANSGEEPAEVIIPISVWDRRNPLPLGRGGCQKIATQLERFTLSLPNHKILREVVFEKSLEMPKVAAALTAQPYRYCYAVDYLFPTSETDIRPLYKVDVESKIAESWSEAGCFPGEPIFVPSPSAQEDEGVVLSLVLDISHHKSFLLILNAKDFTEVARAEAPHAIPIGLHGFWR